jgi:hypothetical protein
MPNIVIIEKNGDMKNMNIKTFAASDLFKKAGFKTPANFDCHTVWNIQHDNKDYSIELHAKNTGRANQENKYEFPPPVDKILFFGSCVLINRKTPSEIDDLYVNDWKNICETLFGGFEDLNEEESEDEACEIEEEREAAKNNKLTKTGYLDDGFVVEDDNDSEESFGDDEESDDENDDENDDDNDNDKDDSEDDHSSVETYEHENNNAKETKTAFHDNLEVLSNINFEKLANDDNESNFQVKKLEFKTLDEPKAVDYKKLSLAKLREIALEKGGVDASKMKKADLLNLLLSA